MSFGRCPIVVLERKIHRKNLLIHCSSKRPHLLLQVSLHPCRAFDGVSNVNGVLPPDTNGDVGPNHYVQWVNLSFAIYSKSGTFY